MAKTDKTRPARVKVFDDPNWLTEHHDHRFGPCDLGPRPTKSDDVRWYGSGGRRVQADGSREPRCFWWFSTSYWHVPSNHCGCPLCSGSLERKAELRKARHEGRKAVGQEQQNAAAVAHGAVTSLADVDDLAGLDDPWHDPWVEEFGNGFEAEVRANARIGEVLGVPAGEIVVAVDHRGGPYDDDRPTSSEHDLGSGLDEYVEVTVMHNDGRREVLSFHETWQEFHARTQ